MEPIDAVRFISNRSSGQMGVALASAVEAQGHALKMVHGPLSVPYSTSFGEWTPVETAREMLLALQERMAWADVLIMSAAVCDMRPVWKRSGDDASALDEDKTQEKIEKSALNELLFEPNPDIVGTLCREFPEKHIVSFSLENDLSLERPLKKMRAKKSHWVVINQLASMGAAASTFVVLDREGCEIIPQQALDKTSFAEQLLKCLGQISL